MPNKLSQFWQELKRRKVVRVITVYAAAAFVILELVSMSEEPFGLPDWTFVLAVILLSIGFLIAIILSWIYDIHPEGGIVKTEPAHEAKAEDFPKSSNSWKIASYISFVVIVGLIVLNITPRTGKKEILDKSIAVLPFHNDSPNQEMYFINGVMEEILDNLCKIEDLRVVSRSSVEQYRNDPKPIPIVAEEMKVSYVLEGSGQRDGDNIRLTVQLLDAGKDQHIWSESYYREIKNIFELQSEVAQLVAQEIEVIITPQEQELIEKIPTTNLTAHDFYLRGREEYLKFWLDNDNLAALETAKGFYQQALAYDPDYALAYAELARVNYRQEIRTYSYLEKDYLDSVLILTEFALSHDNKIAEAFVVRGDCYRERGESKRALEEYQKALEINPNEWEAYYGIGALAFNDDQVWFLENFYKAALLNRGAELPRLLRNIAGAFHWAGFIERAKAYYHEALRHDGDTAVYFISFAGLESIQENYEKAIEYWEKAYAIDSTEIEDLKSIGLAYMYSGQHKESLRYLKIWFDKLTAREQIQAHEMHRMGYAYWVNGFTEEAEYFFDLQMEYCNGEINSNRPYSQLFYTYYDRAAVFAFRGEKEKAYEDLKIFNQRERQGLWMVALIRNDPLFDSIRDEPEFQQIVRDVEAKHQAEHERVRQWLEENDML